MLGVLTTADLDARFRSDVDDPLRGPVTAPDNDSLWSAVDSANYMNDACDKVARVSLSVFKTFSLNVVGGNPMVPLPTGAFTVLDIRHIFLASTRKRLHERNVELDGTYRYDYGFDTSSLSWEVLTGTPREYMRDYIPGQLRLVPSPIANDTITITACIAPNLLPGAPLPFSDPGDIYLMLLWMKKLAYQKHDADTFDAARSKAYEEEFETRSHTRAAEARRLRRAPQPVTFSW